MHSTDFNRTVLVVHAHPDDTEAFCAGSLAILKEKGWEIHIATMTAGGLGGIDSTEKETVETRKIEAEKAASVIGAAYHCLGERDGFVFDSPEIRIKLTGLMRKVKPGIIMTHLPFDYHTDHRTTSNITEASAMMTTLPNHPSPEPVLEKTPLLYHTAPLGFSDPVGSVIAPPHFFLDIGGVMEIRRKMLSFHKTQIELMKVMHGMDNFFGEMEKYNLELGKIAGCKYAEAYWQHLGGGFQKNPLIQDELKDFLKEAH